MLTVTGPRQSGKTTLCRQAFPDHPYVNLENPATLEQALADPSGFVDRHRDGAVFDEVQRAPALMSAIQVVVDNTRGNGRFILSGSHNFQLQASIAQSLAGRTSVLDLLPLAIDELRAFPNAPKTLVETLFAGSYPRIFDREIPPAEFHADYVRTYVERDVRQLLNIQDLGAFQTFLRLCAGRSGGLLNLAALGADAGITHPTAKAWINVLEASYLVRRVQPWFQNLGKRLVKTPKLHWLDSGLLCWLLGIRTPDQIEVHPLRGAIFETWVVAEVLKARANAGLSDPVWFYRDQSGTEVDLLVEGTHATILVEAKSGSRVAPDGVQPLQRVADALREYVPGKPVRTVVVYGGAERATLLGTELLPWSRIDEFDWA
ncbi:MAG: ATP-binding protein [Planctomycetota bacterium]